MHTHTNCHTHTHTGHFRGPQISGASQTMNETGNKNTESIWSHICFLWRYECLYYSPLADSYILLSAPALLVSLQTSSGAIYLHGYNTIFELTAAHHGNTGSIKAIQLVRKGEKDLYSLISKILPWFFKWLVVYMSQCNLSCMDLRFFFPFFRPALLFTPRQSLHEYHFSFTICLLSNCLWYSHFKKRFHSPFRSYSSASSWHFPILKM